MTPVRTHPPFRTRAPLQFGDVLTSSDVSGLNPDIPIHFIQQMSLIGRRDEMGQLTGWECPKCGQVYGPFVRQCDYCVPKSVASTSSKETLYSGLCSHGIPYGQCREAHVTVS